MLKRSFIIAGLVLATILLAQPAHADGGWRWDKCRFQGLQAPKWTQHEEDLTARCAVMHFSVPGGLSKFRAVISCESGWNRNAVSASGTFVGLAQHHRGYWLSRYKAFAPPHWDLKPGWANSRTHLIVTARMVHAGGWGPWSCA